MILADLMDLALKIEGPYKWYVIGAVVVILTAFLTRFIFKTLKWFLIIAAIGVIVFTIVNYFATSGIIDRGQETAEDLLQATVVPSP